MKRNVLLSIVLFAVMAANVVITNSRDLPVSALLDLENVESLAQNESGGGAPTCMAGGCNASSCSFEGEIVVMGNGATYKNSVSCVDAWACCFTTAYCFSKDKCN